MRKRNRIAILITMPIAVVLWGVGWVFELTGSNKKKIAEKTKIHR